MIRSGPTGKNKTSLIWYVDFGASNHMTYPSASLTNVKPYLGNLQIHIADGETLHIKAIGECSTYFTIKSFFF